MGRELPMFPLEGRLPSYQLLAREAFRMCFRRGFRDDSLIDRLVYFGRGLRLRRVARWESSLEAGLTIYLWRAGIRRNAVILFGPILGFAALQAIRQPLTGPAEWLGAMSVIGVGCILGGVAFAAVLWRGLRDDAVWAESYRQARLDLDERLRSTQGVDGWRIERLPDGTWVMVQLPPGNGAT